MPLDQCTFAGSTETRTIRAVGHAPDPAAALIRSWVGAACPVPEPSPHKRPRASGGRKIAALTDSLTETERADSTERALPSHGYCTSTSDYWSPPVTSAQHRRQQVIAIVLAFVLAALLEQFGL